MLNMVEMRILSRVNMYNVIISTSNNFMYNSTIQSILASIVFKGFLREVQLTGGKPKVLRLIISDPFDQVLRFPTNNMVLPDSLDFVVLFTIDF